MIGALERRAASSAVFLEECDTSTIIPSRLAIPAGPIAVPAAYDVQLIDESCNTTMEAAYGDVLTTMNRS